MLLITGYVGSGKTTLLNRLLSTAARRSLKVGLIVHRQAEEYGIAPHGISTRDTTAFCESVYDFGSGCICCSPKGELTRLLSQCASSANVDLIIVRLGPLAAPLLFAKAIVSMGDSYHLSSIICVCEPKYAAKHLSASSEEWQARSQVACSDLIVLNSRVDDNGGCFSIPIGPTSDLVTSINNDAAVENMYGPNDDAGLFSLLHRRECFSIARACTLDPDFEMARLGGAPFAADNDSSSFGGFGSLFGGGGGGGGEVQLVSLTAHDKRLSAGCAVEDGRLYQSKLKTLCTALACSGKVLRMKGVVQLTGEDDDDEEEASDGWLLIEGVEEEVEFRHVASLPPQPEDEDDEEAEEGATTKSRPSKLYVLGRDLAVGSLKRDFQLCRVPRGYSFACDLELAFGRGFAPSSLTAEYTTRVGTMARPPSIPSLPSSGDKTPLAVMSELPGVVIMRVVDEKGDKESITCQHKEAYVALSRPSVFESDEGFCDALRSGWRVDTEGPHATKRLETVEVSGALYVSV